MARIVFRTYPVQRFETEANKALNAGWRVHTVMPYYWNEVGDDEVLTHVAVMFEQSMPNAKELSGGGFPAPKQRRKK
jgi:hypothetical protein